jgi:hypothetical protein
MDIFPSNTVANFKVKLPETISLTGDWEVALVEIQYSNTWSTIRHGTQQTFIYMVGSERHAPVIDSGHYESILDFVKNLNGSLSKDVQDKIKFTYNRRTRKVTIDVKKQASVWFTGDIAAVLGFDQDCYVTKKTTSPYAADINAGFSSMFVYCDIVSDQIVGDKKVPLLRAVQIKGNYGDTITKTYQNPLYIPIGTKQFETLEVHITDESGRRVPFEYGRSICTLHLRPNHSIYF